MLKKIKWTKVAEIVLVSVLLLAPAVLPLVTHGQFVRPDCPPGVRCTENSLSGLIKTIINY
ncbi:MAG TPA: hypothetical protein VHA30_04215, partial [Patescibacteria group bacterium]|nr:hypothetical protein [Patescibacteria group bacterium]